MEFCFQRYRKQKIMVQKFKFRERSLMKLFAHLVIFNLNILRLILRVWALLRWTTWLKLKFTQHISQSKTVCLKIYLRCIIWDISISNFQIKDITISRQSHRIRHMEKSSTTNFYLVVPGCSAKISEADGLTSKRPQRYPLFCVRAEKRLPITCSLMQLDGWIYMQNINRKNYFKVKI